VGRLTCTAHKLVADVALIAEGEVLLVRYRNTDRYDGQTGWFLPDDFLEDLEHPDRAAMRIAKDQLGTSIPSPRLGFIESFGDGAWHLIFHYRADLAQKPRVRLGENVAAMEWFDLQKLPAPADVAHHGWGLATLARLLTAGP
jgi:ADP-ribose pyrophosphatase YjhB (NUDIX family)